MKKLIILLGAVTVSLTSCLKDKPNVDFSNIGAFTELVESGLPYFNNDSPSGASDTISKTIQVNITGQYAPTKDVTVTVGIDNSIITSYNSANTAVAYEQMPTGSFVFTETTVTIKAGTRLANIPVTFYKNKLDPSKSYMLPIKIKSSTIAIANNYYIHYYHFIGNDFAGQYVWDYQRWSNGTGVGVPDITGLGRAGVILPVTPTEFQMETGYNGNGVKYDVTFTRTVVDATHINYSNWTIKFDAANLQIWTDAGIHNIVAPVFVTAPPATNTDPKIFKVNHTSGGGSPRYIIDTYHK